MAKPDYIICLECESEVEGFSWRDGEVRRAACDVCGNTDPDTFSLPEDYDAGSVEQEDEDALEEDEEEEEDADDYREREADEEEEEE
jgi:ferredoxin